MAIALRHKFLNHAVALITAFAFAFITSFRLLHLVPEKTWCLWACMLSKGGEAWWILFERSPTGGCCLRSCKGPQPITGNGMWGRIGVRHCIYHFRLLMLPFCGSKEITLAVFGLIKTLRKQSMVANSSALGMKRGVGWDGVREWAITVRRAGCGV